MSEDERLSALQIASSLRPSLSLSSLKKCVVSISLLVLQDDGSVTETAVLASSLAVALSGRLDMYDIVSACCVGIYERGDEENSETKRDNKDLAPYVLVLDPSSSSSSSSVLLSTLSLSLLSNHSQVPSLSFTGTLPESSISRKGGAALQEAASLAVEACKQLHALGRAALLEFNDRKTLRREKTRLLRQGNDWENGGEEEEEEEEEEDIMRNTP